MLNLTGNVMELELAVEAKGAEDKEELGSEELREGEEA